MRRLSLAVEELMGAQGATSSAAPGLMGPSKPKIALKGQPGAGGAPAGNMATDPKAAGAQLAAALAQAGGAIQNTVDAGVNQANLRQGNPDQSTANGQPQPARTTPQQRMQQQRDELALKKGTLPKDLTDDVANVAQQQKPGMPQKPGIPNQRQPGGAPMESVNEAEGTFKKTHEFVSKDGKHAWRAGRNTTAGTWDHRHYSKTEGGAWKHHPDHGYDGHESKEDAAAAAKADRDEHESGKTYESVNEARNDLRRFKNVAHQFADETGHDHVVVDLTGKAAANQTPLKVMGHEAAEKEGHKVLYRAKPKSKANVKEGAVPKQFMKPDGKMSNPDDVNGYDKVTDAQAKATAKHKAAIKGDAKLGGSTLSKDSGRGSQWNAVRAGKLKSPVKEEERETTVLGDEGRKAILDEFFA